MTSISTSPPRSQRRVREWSSSSHGAPSAGFGREALAQAELLDLARGRGRQLVDEGPVP
jgi:hypothetical protein